MYYIYIYILYIYIYIYIYTYITLLNTRSSDLGDLFPRCEVRGVIHLDVNNVGFVLHEQLLKLPSN